MTYRVKTRMTSYRTYEIEADTPEEAEDKIWSDECDDPEYEDVDSEETIAVFDENGVDVYVAQLDQDTKGEAQ